MSQKKNLKINRLRHTLIYMVIENILPQLKLLSSYFYFGNTLVDTHNTTFIKIAFESDNDLDSGKMFHSYWKLFQSCRYSMIYTVPHFSILEKMLFHLYKVCVTISSNKRVLLNYHLVNRSPNLTILDFFIWSYMIDSVYPTGRVRRKSGTFFFQFL